MLLLLSVSVFHVLLLGLLGQSHDLGVHPVFVLDVESEVRGGSHNGVLEHVRSDAVIDVGSLGFLSSGILVVVVL